MTDFFLSALITGGALFTMFMFFRLAARLSHTLAGGLSKMSVLPDFDFTTTTTTGATKTRAPSLEQRAEQCWNLFKEGLLVEAELQVTDLLKQNLSSRTRVRCLHLLALLLIDQGNLKDAETYFWQALGLQDGYKDPVDELDLRLGAARLFHETNSRELELRQLERVVLLSDQFSKRFLDGFETEVLAPTLLNLGDAYLAEKETVKALNCFNRVVLICAANNGSELLAANARVRLQSINS